MRTKEEWIQWMNFCFWCKRRMVKGGGKNKGLTPTKDHVVPRCYGGGYTPNNIVMACRDCNNRRSEEMQMDWMTHGGKNSEYNRRKWITEMMKLTNQIPG